MSNGSTPPPQQPKFTHALLPLDALTKLSRLLTRLATEGQEAFELLNELQQMKPVTLNPEEQPEAEGPDDHPAAGADA